MPYSEMFELVHLRIPKAADGKPTGFELDMKWLLRLADAAKVLVDNREYMGPEWPEKVLGAMDLLDDFVAWFYPAEQNPGVTTRIDPDDLPNFDFGASPPRAVRREMKRKVKAVWRNGRWESD